MKIVNLTWNEVLEGKNSTNSLRMDYYRIISNYKDNNLLALYYKELIGFNEQIDNENKLDNMISMYLETEKFMYENFDYSKLANLKTRIEKLEEMKLAYIMNILGIALYNNYPVGILIDRDLLNYKNLVSIYQELSLSERKVVLEQVKCLINDLLKHGIYPTCLYLGNILIDKNMNVKLDNFDDFVAYRVESKLYVKMLKKRGRDLIKDSWLNYEEMKKYVLK